MSENIKKEWGWDEPDHYYYVKVVEVDSGTPDNLRFKSGVYLEWGGWETYPKGAGGATYQDPEEFLKTNKPGYE
ncbi:MAG TPA: hypothetical protein ENN73_03720 [Firmicutes bacterium]|nr:hypothetical protein [Bacillota bacterium]